MRALMDVKAADPKRAGWLRHLADDQRGSVAIWVGISLTVFIGCAGLAVDTARGYMVKARLSQALDAAALAGAKSLGSGHAKEDITMFFNANFPANEFDAVVNGPIITPTDPDGSTSPDNTIKVEATATIDATLMSVLGFKTMTVAAEATAIRSIAGLDVVIAIDMSGSMCDPCTKIEAAQAAAKTLVNTVFADPNPKEVTIEGVTYSLLNIGMVPWAGKVNVGDLGAAYKDPNAAVPAQKQEIVTVDTPDFVNPITGIAQSEVYVAKDFSDVRLLSIPPVGWKGSVYARYIHDSDSTNDADLKLGYATFGTGTTKKDWLAYEPILPFMGEPQSGNWTTATGGSTWNGRIKQCGEAYYNVNGSSDTTHPTGTSGIPNRPRMPAMGFTWTIGDQGSATDNSRDCTPTPKEGIRRLKPVRTAAEKQTMIDSISDLYTTTPIPADNFTQAVQGLYWAWEVLMPGAPFNEAKAAVPFSRTQAIVFLTDGQITGKNGDAYKGTFGYHTLAGTTTSKGTMPNGDNNNFNNRLKQLAKNIKGADPTKGVKIYVVQYDEPSTTLKNLLKAVATEPNAPYYYQATNSADLQAAFKAIAASLSVLRLAK